MSLPVAILAGGLATRLRSITQSVPKCLVQVAGKPFVAHQLALLRQAGFVDVTLLLAHLADQVVAELGDGSRFGVRLHYVFDGPRSLGTGGALRNALPQLGAAFLVLYGDSYLECDYRAIERRFLEGGKAGLMTVCRNDDRWDRSNVLFSDGRIVRYEKTASPNGMCHIDYGLGAFRASAFEAYAPETAFDLARVYQDLLGRGELDAFEVPSRFYEVGSPEGLSETEQYLAARAGGEGVA
jgi:NDP-sugar pyrophosphorylase family protein